MVSKNRVRSTSLPSCSNSIPPPSSPANPHSFQPSQFDALKPIHIAGTKGKGSTSAFISSILSQYLSSPSPAPKKVALYTSPHLRFVRERIQINNEPISEEKFAQYFFEVWDRLEAAAQESGVPTDAPTKPVYFRYLTLMALHAYLKEGVDSAVIECGIGGEYDSTNILVHPTITAITSLGIDHVAMLGNTLPEIAWHKAGIMKAGSLAFTAPQKEEALKVLQNRANEKGVELHVVDVHPQLDNGEVKIGLSASYQKINASLAIAVAAAHLRKLGVEGIPDPTTTPSIPLPEQFVRGLETVKWAGRCDVRKEKDIIWNIDGGHTLDSIEVTGRWFADRIAEQRAGSHQAPRILIFNQQTRDANALARALYTALQTGMSTSSSSTTNDSTTTQSSPFTHAIFTTNQTFSTGYSPDLVSLNTNQADVDTLAVQKALAETWRSIDGKAEVRVMRTVEESVEYARGVGREWREKGGEVEVMALVTGSLHLVGGVIDVLERGKGE